MPKQIEEWQRYTWTRQDKQELDRRLERIEDLLTRRRRPLRYAWQKARRAHKLVCRILAEALDNYAMELLDFAARGADTETVWVEDGRMDLKTGKQPSRVRRESDFAQEPPIGSLNYYDQPPEERAYDLRVKIRNVPVLRKRTERLVRPHGEDRATLVEDRRLMFTEETIIKQTLAALTHQAQEERSKMAMIDAETAEKYGTPLVEFDQDWTTIRNTYKTMPPRRY